MNQWAAVVSPPPPADYGHSGVGRLVGTHGWLDVRSGADPEHLGRKVIPAVGDPEQPHPDPPANGHRPLIVGVRDSPNLVEPLGEATGQQAVGGFGRQPLAPTVWMKVPADLDLAVSIGE